MKPRNRRFWLGWMGLGLAAWAASGTAAQVEERITIPRETIGSTPPIPIAMTGYSGEAGSVLRFDLEIAGFKIVPEAEAQYLLQGGSSGQVEGRLQDLVSKENKFAKAYSGGTARTQAHALADDVVLAVTDKAGIARTKIAFKVTRGANSEVYIADYDAHGPQAITADKTVVAAPAWLPGHRTLYYTTYKFGNADIVSQDVDTGNRQIVARYSGSNISPALSRDGRHIAMIMSKGGSPDLWVANADGTSLRQLTRSPEDESSPTWSPDGSTICFATKIDGRRTLATIPASGGRVQRLKTSGVPSPTEPDWSPDGKSIAFTSQMGGFEICVVPAQGGEARLLVSGEDPSWAPNSRTLIITRRGSGGQRFLSLLDVPTKQTKDIGQSIGHCSQPSWAR